MDWEVSLQVSSSGPSHALPPGWYIVSPDSANEGSSGLLGNVPVNGLDEWDINKLGWFKFRTNWNGEEDQAEHMDTGHQVLDLTNTNLQLVTLKYVCVLNLQSRD